MKRDQVEDLYELSPMQQGMLYHCLAVRDPSVYVITVGYEIEGPLDVSSLRRAWQAVVDRNPVLRSSFHWRDVEKPLQLVQRSLQAAFEDEDWRSLDPGERGPRFAARLEAQHRRGFGLDRAPLSRMTLIRLAEERFRLIWSFHHTLIEGWSASILLGELAACYRSLSRGEPPRLAPRRPYREFIGWLQEQDHSEAERFWRERLRGLRTPSLLAAPPGKGSAGSALTERLPVALPSPAVESLGALARKHRLTLNTLFQGAWALLLSRYRGESDVVFGSTVSGREIDLPDAASMVGLFINTLPTRVAVPGGAPLIPWLEELQAREHEARRHAHSSLVQIHGWSEMPRGSALFDTLFAFENWHGEMSFDLSDEIRVSACEMVEGASDYPLALNVNPGTPLAASLTYDRRRFARAAAIRLSQHLSNLLAAMARDPEAKLSQLKLPLIGETEREQLIRAWNATEVRHPSEGYVHEMFRGWARRAGASPALSDADGGMSYGELDAASDGLAARLAELGVGPGALVAVVMERSVEMVSAFLAVLKCGAAYVPMDPAYPRQRLEFMLEDAAAAVVLTEPQLRELLPPHGGRVICPAADAGVRGETGAAPPAPALHPEDLAYVIYTSGSTGRPKGVAVSHGALLNLVHWHRRAYGVTPADRATQVASPGFDACVWELWPYLSAGASVHVVDDASRGEPRKLWAFLARERITLSFLPTPLAEAALRSTSPLPDGLVLRALLTGGDRLRRTPERPVPFELVNHYGPTENAVVSTACTVRAREAGPAPPPIGRPIDNVRTYVLDDDGQLLPIGVPGQLYVAGASLARGYLNRPELTAERFVADPFAEDRPGRLYATGDRVRLCEDGQLEFLGRADGQVKVRGFRIELGEIEAALADHPGVADVAVDARAGDQEERALVAYVVPADGSPANDGLWRELRHHLSERLPDYMVPAHFVALEALPQSANGKVERSALPDPDRVAQEPVEDGVPPRTATEEALARIWSEVLSVPTVGVETSFFELGGHSLLALRMISAIRKELSAELPMERLFENPTVAGLARLIDQGREETAGSRPALTAGPRGEDAPLSFEQRRLWLVDRLDPGNPAYNMPFAFRLGGALDRGALERALREVARRHDVLRTGFAAVDGGAVQRLFPEAPAPTAVDLTGLDRGAQAARLDALMEEEARHRFRLDAAPPWRARIVALAPDDHLLQLTFHHIIFDGWSMRVLFDELGAVYEALAAGRPSPLPEPRIQYADFARWQRRWLERGELDRQLAYWRSRLEGAPPELRLPLDRPRGPGVGSRGAQLSFDVPAAPWNALVALGREHEATAYMTLLAVFLALLQRYTGQTDLLVGTPVANRSSTELEGLVGLVLNTIVIRADLEGDPSYRELLRRVRSAVLGAFAHQELPFERLVEALEPERSPHRPPLIQVMFNLLGFGGRRLALPGIEVRPLAPVEVGPKLDLNMFVEERAGELRGAVVYDAGLFDEATVARMVESFKTLIEGVTGDPDAPVATLPLGEDGAGAVLIGEFNERVEWS